MDLDGLPVIGSGVDYTQVGAIHQRRTLAFVNHFVTSTASFLNNFSRSCEIRLQKCEARIQKLEASLYILEAKLTSIPGLSDTPDPHLSQHLEASDVSQVPDSAVEVMPEVTPDCQVDNTTVPSASLETPAGMTPAKEDPIYKRFFRMVQVGVPEPAVRLKMQAEGLDPNIISNPDQLVPSRKEQSLHSTGPNQSSDSNSE